MKKLLSSILLLGLLTGCPSVELSDQGIEFFSNETLPGQEEYESRVLQDLGDYLGNDLSEVGTRVYWTHTECPGTEQTAVIYKEVCYSGLMFTCKSIYVAYRDGDFGSTSLAHELGHCALQKTFDGDGDSSHSREDFWSYIREIR